LYVSNFNSWANDTSKWMLENMGESARDRFLDYGPGFSFNCDRAVNEQHNTIINLTSAFRKNLTTLIESDAWDR
jgi:hypothetical protein